jgi:TRAP-type C4-dicarboxylate transport system permease small subunit
MIFGWLVYGRYVLNSTPTWVEQVSLLLIVLIGFLGASVGIYRKTHLGVSYFKDHSPRPIRRFFEFASYIMLGVFGALMMYYSYGLMLFKWGSEIPLLGISEGFRAIPIMLCGGLTMLYCIGHVIDWFCADPTTDSADTSNQSHVDSL